MVSLHTPIPWQVQPNVNGLIPLCSVRPPYSEACLVPTNGHPLEAERNAEMIAQLTQAAHDEPTLNDIDLRAAVRRAASLSIAFAFAMPGILGNVVL